MIGAARRSFSDLRLPKKNQKTQKLNQKNGNSSRSQKHIFIYDQSLCRIDNDHFQQGDQVIKKYASKMNLGLFVAAISMSTATQAAVISADSQYFKDWQFATFSPNVSTPVVGTPINAVVAGLPFTITASNMAASGGRWLTWNGGTSSSLMGSTDLPVNIGLPTAPGNVWELGGGEVSIKFPVPMPKGTTLFSHDFDNADAVEYRFYRCNGSQMNASPVEFLQISTGATEANPVQTPPVAGATDSFWKLESPTTGGLGGTTVGLILNMTGVCEIRTKELGRPRHSTVDFQLGIPPRRPAGEPTPVPTVGPAALGLLSLSVAGIALVLPRRKRK